MAEATPGDGLDAAVRLFRVAALAWLAVVTVLSAASIDAPDAAAAGVTAAAVVTVSWWRASGPTADHAGLLTLELVVGMSVVAADGVVYADGRAQSFGGIWPLAGVLAAGVAAGPVMGAGAGLLIGIARALSEVAIVAGEWSATRALGIASTAVLFAIGGAAAGWATGRIRLAERASAVAAARAEVAAELHDGVLQTLAVVQRRSEDDALVRLARTQEAELRRYLSADHHSGSEPGSTSVDDVLRDAVADATGRFGLRVEIAAVPPLPFIDTGASGALRGAVAEALANVAKHSGQDRAVVFVEHTDDGLVVAVSDDGIGFDPLTVDHRGLQTSIADRLDRHGGVADLQSAVGRGTSITLRLPLLGPRGPQR